MLALAVLRVFAFALVFVFDAGWPGRLPTAGELRALALALPFKAPVGVAVTPEVGPMAGDR